MSAAMESLGPQDGRRFDDLLGDACTMAGIEANAQLTILIRELESAAVVQRDHLAQGQLLEAKRIAIGLVSSLDQIAQRVGLA